MSTLNVGTIKSLGSSAPIFQNSSGVEKGQLARAWVNFDGTGTVAIKDSFNVSSITDNGTGDYFVNFTVAMPNKLYAVTVSSNLENNNSRHVGTTGNSDHTDSDYISSGFRITCEQSDGPNFGGGRLDCNRICASIFGD
tara:strand:+ start:12 stop:428 length:417 start_codon:yes stop_codon:yes gene_type:complete